MPVNAHGVFVNKEVLRAGDLVIWTCNKELRGCIGMAKNSYAEMATVTFPGEGGGEWNFRMETLRKMAVGDTMRYKGAKPDVPQGFGIVSKLHDTGMISVQYELTSRPRNHTVVKYVGNMEGVPKDEFGLICDQNDNGCVVQYQRNKWENLSYADLRLEFDIPYVALQYIDVRTALTAHYHISNDAEATQRFVDNGA
jgi:hypothetical protein